MRVASATFIVVAVESSHVPLRRGDLYSQTYCFSCTCVSRIQTSCCVKFCRPKVSYECMVYLWRVVRCVFRFLWRYIVSCAVTPMVLVVGFIWRSTATPVINNRIHYFARTSIKDTETYRLGYPVSLICYVAWKGRGVTCHSSSQGKADNPSLVDNYRFYANEIPSRPDGDLIDDIHERWWGQYNKLESHHGYIQW